MCVPLSIWRAHPERGCVARQIIMMGPAAGGTRGQGRTLGACGQDKARGQRGRLRRVCVLGGARHSLGRPRSVIAQLGASVRLSGLPSLSARWWPDAKQAPAVALARNVTP